MTKQLLFILSLFIGITTYGQTESVPIDRSFEDLGFRQISKVELTPKEIEKITNYDFEQFRKKNSSVIIKIIDGPHLELFSKNRYETGALDEPDGISHHESHSDQNTATHFHIEPSEAKIKKFEIIVLNVFDVPSELESN